MTDHTQLRKLAEAATPGPWHWDSDPVKNDAFNRIRYQVTALGKTVTKIYYSSYESGPTNAQDDAAFIAAANPQAVIELLAEIELLRKDAEKLERVAKSMSDVIDNHCIAMQSALIEANEGNYSAGLGWIWNTLAGPGLVPDFDEAKAMGGAQAWFDAKTAESEKLRKL